MTKKKAEIQATGKSYKEKITTLQHECTDAMALKATIESDIKLLNTQKKTEQEEINKNNKYIDDSKKKYKKATYENANICNNIKELTT